MKRWYHLPLDLGLFDGEGTPSGGQGDGAAAAGESADISAAQASAAGKHRARNPLANVIYGKQTESDVSAAGTGTGNQETLAAGGTGAAQGAGAEGVSAEAAGSEAAAGQAETFESLIKGKYKDDFNRKVQAIIDRRFAETKDLEKARDDVAPILTYLSDRYGVQANDYAGIKAAIEADDAFYEERAMELGMDPKQYRNMMQLQTENQVLRERQQEIENRRQADRILATWRQQFEEVKSLYPGADFDTELMNPDIGRILRTGMPFKTAYEAVHHNEIMQGTIAYAVQQTRSDTARTIRSRQARPQENGLGAKGAAEVKSDVSKLTKEDRREIARRAAAGERIVF